jgi:hypothetical protein
MLKETRKILDQLATLPLLMKQHRGLASVVSLLTGEDLKHSWWSHPQSHLLFRVMSELTDHPDVLVCKLLYQKDTFVHRQLFPALLKAAESKTGKPLGSSARQLLARVEARDAPLPARGIAAKELVLRLKVHAIEVHTSSGRHELGLESWRRWAVRASVVPEASAEAAEAALRTAALTLGAADVILPF